ncbi:YceD family protein [Sphingorhabdus sp.]|uniref:YceD family protein n=1 Tax=Sphingorhabdus sp. TaxID=1902408 RepID=UPI003919E0E5
MVMRNEFSHVIKLSEIGSHSRNIQLVADDAARRGLMARFDLAALDSLKAEITLTHDAEGVVATGRFTAELAQFCIASHDPVPATMDEAIHIRFIPEPVVSGEVELELEADDCDTMFHDGQTIDLGEAVAQSLGLALNPYPRSPEAEKMLKAAGVKSEEDVVPPGPLAGLKDLLAKK